MSQDELVQITTRLQEARLSSMQRLGLDYIYIQLKRWEATVGRPVVQAFAGSLDEQKARKGMMITTAPVLLAIDSKIGLIVATQKPNPTDCSMGFGFLMPQTWWSERRDSNPQPPAWEAGALPLRHSRTPLM
jgi:hypothetical protein